MRNPFALIQILMWTLDKLYACAPSLYISINIIIYSGLNMEMLFYGINIP